MQITNAMLIVLNSYLQLIFAIYTNSINKTDTDEVSKRKRK